MFVQLYIIQCILLHRQVQSFWFYVSNTDLSLSGMSGFEWNTKSEICIVFFAFLTFPGILLLLAINSDTDFLPPVACGILITLEFIADCTIYIVGWITLKKWWGYYVVNIIISIFWMIVFVSSISDHQIIPAGLFMFSKFLMGCCAATGLIEALDLLKYHKHLSRSLNYNELSAV